MSDDDRFATAVERNREHLLGAPMLENLLPDIDRFGPAFVDELLHQAADGWLADGLPPTIVRARILGIRQAIRKATDA